MIKLMGENNYNSRIIYPTKLSFKNKSKIKTFLDNHKL